MIAAHLFFLKVHLENVGAGDIVDGNPKITLGLIWTIILRFQVLEDIYSSWYNNLCFIGFYLACVLHFSTS